MTRSLNSTKSAFSDDDLLQLQAGDVVAFKKAYDLYVGLVQFVLRRMRLCDEDADDVAQEVFIKLHRGASGIRSAGSMAAWLSVTARRCAIDMLRRKKTTLSLDETPGYEKNFAVLIEDENSKIAKTIDLEIVAELVKKVGGEQQGKAFEDFYVAGLTAREIAEKNGEATSTVTARLSRLRGKFRDVLKQHIEDLSNSAQ